MKKYARIKEIGKVITGKTPSTENEDNFGGDFPFITPSDISTFDEKYIAETERTISSKGYKKLENNLLPMNSVCFVCIGSTIGKMCLTNKPSFTNQQINALLVNENYDSQYVFYLLRYVKGYFQQIGAGTGSGKGIVNKSTFEKSRICVEKDLFFQKKIATMLSAYDELIENNNKRIKILEQIAENLYKEWFVRFRFPGHETAEFENGIPKGWDIVKLKKIAKLKSGYAFKSEWWTEIGVPVIKIKDIQDGKITLHQLDCVSKENAEKAKKFMVQSGDLLIALTGATIGKTALIVYEGYLVNQRVGKFFVKNPSVDYIGFLYCLINRPWIQEKIICYAGSNAAQPNISPLDIENFKILYNKEIVDKFNVKIKTIIKMIISLQKTNFLLIKQRDLLLPRLMSGKLEV